MSSISPENEHFIRNELASGTYRDRDELVDEAIRLLRLRRNLERDIQAGTESGPSISAEAVFEMLESKAKQLQARDRA